MAAEYAMAAMKIGLAFLILGVICLFLWLLWRFVVFLIYLKIMDAFKG